MKYLCFGYYNPTAFEKLPQAELEGLVNKCRTHDEALHQSGRLIAVGSLASPRAAISVRPQNGKPAVTDGPFAEAKEVIGAFFLIEAHDEKEAVEVASKHPAAHLGEHVGWGVEVRAIDFFKEGNAR
ncbi:MAG TPA: YciI family protein [Steroidobacteraceae bacterium]|nr:YciI family protein [Steroidobacteraceae bacterium]